MTLLMLNLTGHGYFAFSRWRHQNEREIAEGEYFEKSRTSFKTLSYFIEIVVLCPNSCISLGQFLYLPNPYLVFFLMGTVVVHTSEDCCEGHTDMHVINIMQRC